MFNIRFEGPKVWNDLDENIKGFSLPAFKNKLKQHIKLCLLLWFEFFRTIALLLGALRDLIVGYSKSSSASVKCRREIFGRANFHPRVVSLGINVFSVYTDVLNFLNFAARQLY